MNENQNLLIQNPELAKQWHPTKNGELTPEDVTVSSNRKVWWLLAFDDPRTGKHFDFEWEATVAARIRSGECPFLSGRMVWIGFNDLETLNPELAKEWHPSKNGDLTPRDVTPYSMKKIWWIYPYDDPRTGEHFDFEWKASVATRNNGNTCPFLRGKGRVRRFRRLDSKLASGWHSIRNEKLIP